MKGISINVVLSRIEQTTDENGNPVIFSIEFIKEDGTIRSMNAKAHVKNGVVRERSNFKYNLNKKGAILLFDTDEQGYRTVKIDSITKFNNLDVIH